MRARELLPCIKTLFYLMQEVLLYVIKLWQELKKKKLFHQLVSGFDQ